jgi:hypothetical protein
MQDINWESWDKSYDMKNWDIEQTANFYKKIKRKKHYEKMKKLGINHSFRHSTKV